MIYNYYFPLFLLIWADSFWPQLLTIPPALTPLTFASELPFSIVFIQRDNRLAIVRCALMLRRTYPAHTPDLPVLHRACLSRARGVID